MARSKQQQRERQEENWSFDIVTLECEVCKEVNLAPPIQQCSNGHVACATCWAKLGGKCHECGEEGGGCVRNLALERVMGSMRRRCRNYDSGCREMLSYCRDSTNMPRLPDQHEATCFYTPHDCPFKPECSFRGPLSGFRTHFKLAHGNRVRCTESSSVTLNLLDDTTPEYSLLELELGCRATNEPAGRRFYLVRLQREHLLGKILSVSSFCFPDLRETVYYVVSAGKDDYVIFSSTTPPSSSTDSSTLSPLSLLMGGASIPSNSSDDDNTGSTDSSTLSPLSLLMPRAAIPRLKEATVSIERQSVNRARGL